MGKITMELLRKRSEHNEGEIHSLEELALHQEKLEKIELIDKVCRNLKILLLQNNAIAKIENVAQLKNLEYLNLALNIVEKIENLERCESLKKLDLTLNFVAELTSVKTLSSLPHFEQLYLVGNPCQEFKGYRDFVIGVLPALKSLDGREITQAEKIQARQELDKLEKVIRRQQAEYFADQNCPESKSRKYGIHTNTVIGDDNTRVEKVGAVGEDSDSDDESSFWNQKTSNTPEVRKEMIRRLEIQDEKKKPRETKKITPVRKLTNAEGKRLNINEAKVPFFLNDEWNKSQLVLDLAVPKHMCTSLIHADVHPFYVTVTMKGKIFQLLLPDEVRPDSSNAQRSQTTGHLIVTMPKVHDANSYSKNSEGRTIDLRSKVGSGDFNTPNKKIDAKECVEKPLRCTNILSSQLSTRIPAGGRHFDESSSQDEVPPLI